MFNIFCRKTRSEITAGQIADPNNPATVADLIEKASKAKHTLTSEEKELMRVVNYGMKEFSWNDLLSFERMIHHTGNVAPYIALAAAPFNPALSVIILTAGMGIKLSDLPQNVIEYFAASEAEKPAKFREILEELKSDLSKSGPMAIAKFTPKVFLAMLIVRGVGSAVNFALLTPEQRTEKLRELQKSFDEVMAKDPAEVLEFLAGEIKDDAKKHTATYLSMIAGKEVLADKGIWGQFIKRYGQAGFETVLDIPGSIVEAYNDPHMAMLRGVGGAGGAPMVVRSIIRAPKDYAPSTIRDDMRPDPSPS